MFHFDPALRAKLERIPSQKEWLAMLRKELMRKPRFGFNTHGNVIPVPNPGGKNVTIIAAMDNHNGIGKDNQIPWKISEDLRQFKRLTQHSTVIMGRKTFESLGCKPLPNRLNVVLTRDIPGFYDRHSYDNLVAMWNLKDAIETCQSEQVFIIGGGEIYRQTLEMNLAHDMLLTRIQRDTECDAFFPKFDTSPAWLAPVYSTHALSGGGTMRYEYWRRATQEPLYLKE
jgi:dihydrofolate reductase